MNLWSVHAQAGYSINVAMPGFAPFVLIPPAWQCVCAWHWRKELTWFWPGSTVHQHSIGCIAQMVFLIKYETKNKGCANHSLVQMWTLGWTLLVVLYNIQVSHCPFTIVDDRYNSKWLQWSCSNPGNPGFEEGDCSHVVKLGSFWLICLSWLHSARTSCFIVWFRFSWVF